MTFRDETRRAIICYEDFVAAAKRHLADPEELDKAWWRDFKRTAEGALKRLRALQSQP